MKVNSLYPIIVSEKPEEAIEFYRDLGFEIKHDAVTLPGSHVYILSNGDMEMEIMEKIKGGPVDMPSGLYGFRMNVEDIDKAYSELKEKGCTIIKEPFETARGKNMLIKDNQGINITIIQHIKK